MNILILRSSKNSSIRGPYTVRMDTHYAERVINHLRDNPHYCCACEKKCQSCRKNYSLNFSQHIVDILDFPSILPVMLDDPEYFLPHDIPGHDILLVFAVNEEIIIAFINKFPVSKGILVPIEGSDWISPNGKHQIQKLCSEKGIDVAFPKPFCSFSPSNGILLEFSNYFRIGKPELKFTISNNKITQCHVVSSAPCGATYFTAQGLLNKHIDENLTYIIDKQLSCYPCTADTAVDKEFNDSIIHQAVKIQRDILTGC